jgi:surface antigen
MPHYGKIRSRKNKSKFVTYFTKYPYKHLTSLCMVSLFVVGSALGTQQASAQTLQQQINQLNQANQGTQSSLNELDVIANNYQEAISTLQAQIDAVLSSIIQNQAQRDALNVQIAEKIAELEKQRDTLGKSIRKMYLESDLSTTEMVLTSNSLSEYIDKAHYRETVQNKINETVVDIKATQAELERQKIEKESLIRQQQDMQTQLDAQRAEQNRLLSLNQAQQDELTGQMRANNTRIAELRRLQAAEIARQQSANGGRRLNVPDTTGYPWSAVQPFPNSYSDPWGMYKRQCVSYTAWKVYKDGKRMPYWGGRGNAKNWANNARAEGIPVFSTPQRGDIAVSTRGTYGHVMYVEDVFGNGMMRISQYNAGWDGEYSEAIISTSGLEYVRFP